MKYEGMSLKDAFLKVRSSRYIIGPNDGFISQLREFEKELCP
jgi:hypothetical protein